MEENEFRKKKKNSTNFFHKLKHYHNLGYNKIKYQTQRQKS